MCTLNWPEPYGVCREGAVNRLLTAGFTGLNAERPAECALRTLINHAAGDNFRQMTRNRKATATRIAAGPGVRVFTCVDKNPRSLAGCTGKISNGRIGKAQQRRFQNHKFRMLIASATSARSPAAP
jgi:hypothetical protein